jgi:hypothetical protein
MKKKVARTKNYPSFSGGCEVGWAGVSVMSIVTRNVCLKLKLLGWGMDELNPHNDLLVFFKCICRDTLTECKKLVRVLFL